MSPSDRWHAEARTTQTRLAVAAILVASVAGSFITPIPLGIQLVLLAVGVLTLGMPHGALDHRVAEVCLRPRLSRHLCSDTRWRTAFAGAYLLLAGLVVGVWLVAPVLMLLMFLAYSAVHFGLGDQPHQRFDRVLAHGALPILLPAALHPVQTGQLLSIVAGAEISLIPWLAGIRWAAAIALGGALAHAAARRQAAAALEIAAILAANVVFEPLLAFGLYFVLLHSTRHLLELASWLDPDNPRRGLRRLARECMPLTLATVALMAAGLLLIQPVSLTSGVIRVLFITLSALTVPHMLVTEMAVALNHPGRTPASTS